MSTDASAACHSASMPCKAALALFPDLSDITSVDRQESVAEDIICHSNSQRLPIIAGGPKMYSAKDAGASYLIESC